MKKKLIGLFATIGSFTSFGYFFGTPEVEVLSGVEAQLVKYQEVTDQFDELELTVQEIELALVELEEDYQMATEWVEQYESLQKTLYEAEGFDPADGLADELNALQNIMDELYQLEKTQSEISPVYEAERAEHDVSDRARRLGLVQATVTNIVDGDTIDVTVNGTSERVRFIGVDSPERGQRGFNEATEFTRSEIARVGDTVWLQASGADRDNTSSRRLRRYIWLGVPNSLTNAGERSQLNLNQRLVDHGHAVVWTPGGGSTGSTSTQNANTNPNNEMTVYWTVNGSVWHRRRNCRGLSNANPNNIRSGTIAQSGKARECQHSARGR